MEKEKIKFEANSETLLVSKEEYFSSENDIKKQLNETLDLLNDIIKTIKKQFDDVSLSDRAKYKYSNLYSESLIGLIKNKTNILKDLSSMNEKRLINSSKLRTELKQYNTKDKDDNSINLVELHNSLANMFGKN